VLLPSYLTIGGGAIKNACPAQPRGWSVTLGMIARQRLRPDDSDHLTQLLIQAVFKGENRQDKPRFQQADDSVLTRIHCSNRRGSDANNHKKRYNAKNPPVFDGLFFG